MDKRITVIVLIFFLVLLFTSPLQAWSPRLERADYIISSSFSEIESLQLMLNISFDALNEFNSLFHYDGRNFNLQGTWLLNFWQRQNRTMQLRLSAATDFQQPSLAPSLGLGGEFSLGERSYLLYSLDYYLLEDSNSLVYRGGFGLPLVGNSGLTFTVGNSYWSRTGPKFALGIRVQF